MPVGLVRDADGRVGLVDVLAAGAGRAVGVDLEVVVLDLDLAGLLDHRRDLDARERRLAPVGGVERRQPDEPVDALLGAVEAVRVLARDAERRRLDAGLLPRARLEQLDLEAAPLGPAHHHPQDHLRPVLGVRPARARVDRDERVAGVVGPGEQPLLLEHREPLLDRVQRLLELGRELRDPPRPARPARRGRRCRTPARRTSRAGAGARAYSAFDLGGGLRVVPEARARPSGPPARRRARSVQPGQR